MKLLSFVIFLAAVYEIHSTASRFCGDALVQVLEAVCINGYNGMQIRKKSIEKPLNHALLDLNGLNDIEDDTHTPFKSNSLLSDLLYGERLNTLAKTRRQRHLTGVYDECCRKPCVIDELMGYCL